MRDLFVLKSHPIAGGFLVGIGNILVRVESCFGRSVGRATSRGLAEATPRMIYNGTDL